MAEIVNKYPVGIQTFEMIREEGLKHYLDLQLKPFEELYGSDEDELYPNDRLDGLVKRAHKQTGKKVVVTSGPQRGPTFNNRWWNDRRSWNLRTSIRREKSSPRGASNPQSSSCSPPLGTIGESVSTIRRFHDLRSFHQRLFTFAPFGDGWMPLCRFRMRCTRICNL